MLNKLNFQLALPALFITLLSFSALHNSAHAQERVTWKMHSAYPSNVEVLGSQATRLPEMVRKLSGGSFRIRFYEPNALLPAYDYFEPLTAGAIPAAFGAAGFHAGHIKALSFFNVVPFGPRLGEYLAWMRHGGGEELLDEIYSHAGLKGIVCGLIPPEASGWFRQEVTSLEDLRGMKMRIFGFGGKVLERYGVSPQTLPGGDIYPALELGTIDATEYSMPIVDEGAGFYEIAEHYYFPGWHQPTSLQLLEINRNEWDRLSDRHKSILEIACAANVTETLAEAEYLQFGAIKRMQEKGVELHRWSDEVLSELRKGWESVVEEEAKTDPMFARVWESYRKFRDDYQVWRELGYVD